MGDRCRNRSARRLVANDLDRAVCPDPSALSPTALPWRALRRGPPQLPQCLCPQNASRSGAPRFRLRQRARLQLLDSCCDHRPFPERNNAGGMWRECGADRSLRNLESTAQICLDFRGFQCWQGLAVAHITLLTTARRPLSARWRACEAPHWWC